MPWILTMVEVKPDSTGKTGEGEMVYRVNCAACHGLERQGTATANYPSLISVSDKYTRKGILDLINTGRGFMPSFKHLQEQKKDDLISFLMGQRINPGLRQEGTGKDAGISPYTHTGYNRFTDQNGYPGVKPPWGIISAIDLNKGTILWQVPLGNMLN